MNAPTMTLKPIGVIHSEHIEAARTPIQPVFAEGCLGRAEILPEFADGLTDIEGFSHVYLIYWLHQAPKPQLKVKPFLQDVEHGIFATRAPGRPNPLGMSLVRLVRREGNVLHLAGVDVLDGTPLLDIKPYSPRYDTVADPRSGWLETVDETTARQRGLRGFQGAGAATLSETPQPKRKTKS